MWLLWKECCSVVKATRNWRYVHICVWVSAKEVLIDISSSTSNYLGKGVVWQTQCACVCSLMYTAAYSTCVCLCLHACVCKRCCHCVCREVWQGTQGQLEIKSHLTVVCWNALWGKKVSWSPPRPPGTVPALPLLLQLSCLPVGMRRTTQCLAVSGVASSYHRLLHLLPICSRCSF